MRQHSIPTNTATYNAFMDVCSKCGDLQAALSTLTTMQSHGINPDIVSFNILVHACCKHEATEQLLALRSRMSEMRISPDAMTVSTIASTFTGSSTCLEQVLAAYKE